MPMNSIQENLEHMNMGPNYFLDLHGLSPGGNAETAISSNYAVLGKQI